MAVYVDNMYAPFGRMRMCHMIADTTQELLVMADLIGVDRKWIQHKGTPKEHFDVCIEKRKSAVKFGAIETTKLDLSLRVHMRNGQDHSDCGVCRGFRSLTNPKPTQIDLI